MKRFKVGDCYIHEDRVRVIIAHNEDYISYLVFRPGRRVDLNSNMPETYVETAIGLGWFSEKVND